MPKLHNKMVFHTESKDTRYTKTSVEPMDAPEMWAQQKHAQDAYYEIYFTGFSGGTTAYKIFQFHATIHLEVEPQLVHIEYSLILLNICLVIRNPPKQSATYCWNNLDLHVWPWSPCVTLTLCVTLIPMCNRYFESYYWSKILQHSFGPCHLDLLVWTQ